MKVRNCLVTAKLNSNCCLSSRVSFLAHWVTISKRMVGQKPSPSCTARCSDSSCSITTGVGRGRMTQTQMTTYLADKIGISKRQAKSTLDELNELVTRQLKKEGLLRLAGLGVFRKRKTKARMGRNPATGEQLKIPARTRLRFTPAKALKDSVLGQR